MNTHWLPWLWMQRLLHVAVLLSLLFTPLQSIAAYAPPSAPPEPVEPGTPESTGLYRTTVTVRTPADWARLEELGVVVLEATNDQRPTTNADAHPSSFVVRPSSLVVLADADQLEALARLRFEPRSTDELGALVMAHAQEKPWLVAGVRRLERGWLGLTDQPSGAGQPIRASERSVLSALAALTSVDDDADGLTNTQEAWWCTDPMNPDTDSDGKSDGAEIRVLKDWLANRRSAPPYETPWPDWPPQRAGCEDKDHDSIPNLAERWELGLLMDLESSDRDKFDDGQELFGVTYCPGGDLSCNYGDLPRSSDSGYVGATMPAWVKPPGNHPLVAAFPVPEIDVVESSLHVEAVTEITDGRTVTSGTERSYSTSKTEGTSTSRADTQTWSEWQEVSLTTPIDNHLSLTKPGLTGITAIPPLLVIAAGAYAACEGWNTLGGGDFFFGDSSLNTCGGLLRRGAEKVGEAVGYLFSEPKNVEVPPGTEIDPDDIDFDSQGMREALQGCRIDSEGNLKCDPVRPPTDQEELSRQAPVAETQDRNDGGSGHRISSDGRSRISVQNQIEISVPIPRQLPTRTETSGRSVGGAVTTTHTEYEEHTVTEGEAFLDQESWTPATAVDSSHAAELWFTYKVRNTGTEYSREIGDLAFNIYINDDPNPAVTYFVAPELGGDGKFHNFMPDEEHTYTLRRIPLTLNQMNAIDVDPACAVLKQTGQIAENEKCPGGRVRIVVEDFTYGVDELFYQDAVNAGVQIAIEDGTDDGDEAIDTYLIPT